GAIVLENNGVAEPSGRLGDVLLADRREGRRRLDAERGERLVLRYLRDFERDGPLAVDDGAAVTGQPGEDRGGEFRRIAVVAGMRRRAHAVVENALRRRLGEVEHALVEKPLRERNAACLEGRPQRFDPGVVFVDDED